MREKILIVEDEEEIAMLEQDYLEINGFQTRIESDGEQAVELALTGEFDRSYWISCFRAKTAMISAERSATKWMFRF